MACNRCGENKVVYITPDGLFEYCRKCGPIIMTEKEKDKKATEVQIGGQHYKTFVIQPVEFIVKNRIPFIEGNIIKYACRWKDKGGIQDLKKIIHYAELLIQLEEERTNDTNNGTDKSRPELSVCDSEDDIA